MTDHLPECHLSYRCHGLTGITGSHATKMDFCTACHRVCICPELRACEQRVRNQDIATHHADLKEAKALLASRDESWFAGVEAAREAVAAVEYRPTNLETMIRSMVFEAIDALREDSETPPPLPPSAGVPERRWT